MTERARLFKDDGSLSQGGLLIIKDALFAKLFDERRDIIEAMSDSQRRALEASIPTLISLRSMIVNGAIPSTWDLVRSIGEAVLFAGRNLRDTTIGDYLRQTSFIAREPFNPDTLMGQSLFLLDKFGTKPRVLREKIQQFATEASYEMGSLFRKSKRNPVEILKELIGEYSLSGIDAKSYPVQMDKRGGGTYWAIWSPEPDNRGRHITGRYSSEAAAWQAIGKKWTLPLLKTSD